jgi:hypothetical protein
MTVDTSSRKPARLNARLTRQHAVARKTALIVAALLVAALLGPFVVGYVAG